MTPYKIVKRHQDSVDSLVSALLNKSGFNVTVRAYVVDQRGGFAYYKDKVITVPLWAYKRGKGYFTYYVAHELSHLIALPLGREFNGDYYKGYFPVSHGEHFYTAFFLVCPKSYQHYEKRYRPKNYKRFKKLLDI